MKKFWLLLTLATLTLSLAACQGERKGILSFLQEGLGKEESSTTEATTTEETTTETPTTEAPTTEASTAPVPEMPYEDQIALLAVNYPQWVKTDSAVPYSFAVTDLDRNGRLEVITSVCMGTGIFTYTDIWEINETYDGVMRCETDFDEYYSQADIIDASLTAFARGGDYYYIVTDYIRNGYAYHAAETRSMCLKDGVYSETLLAYCVTEVSEDYEETTTYYDADATVISEAEFETMSEVCFADARPYTATLGWISFYEDEIEAMDTLAWENVLTDSWQSFGLTEAG
ncbi:MAG: hypothetical protein ACI4V3_04190 [Faecousia sp.]